MLRFQIDIILKQDWFKTELMQIPGESWKMVTWLSLENIHRYKVTCFTESKLMYIF